jgi:hypothetical protein
VIGENLLYSVKSGLRPLVEQEEAVMGQCRLRPLGG